MYDGARSEILQNPCNREMSFLLEKGYLRYPEYLLSFPLRFCSSNLSKFKTSDLLFWWRFSAQHQVYNKPYPCGKQSYKPFTNFLHDTFNLGMTSQVIFWICRWRWHTLVSRNRKWLCWSQKLSFFLSTCLVVTSLASYSTTVCWEWPLIPDVSLDTKTLST